MSEAIISLLSVANVLATGAMLVSFSLARHD